MRSQDPMSSSLWWILCVRGLSLRTKSIHWQAAFVAPTQTQHSLQNQDGTRISKVTGIKRLLPTLLGLGNLTVLFDRKKKLSLQDRITNTEVVVLSLEANKGRL